MFGEPNAGKLASWVREEVVTSNLAIDFPHYTPHVDLAFNSIEYIMRDVRNGWLIRYIHANGASMCVGMTHCKVFLSKAH